MVLDEQLLGTERSIANLVAVNVTSMAMGSMSIHGEMRAGSYEPVGVALPLL